VWGTASGKSLPFVSRGGSNRITSGNVARTHSFLLVLALLLTSPGGRAQDASPDAARAAVDEAHRAWNEGSPQKTLPLAERAVALAERGSDRALLAQALELLGRSRWGRGQYDAALEAHRRGLAIFRELNDAGGESEMLIRIGETMYSLGRYTEALEQYDLALTANTRGAPPSRLRESSIRSNMGVALRYLGRFDEAAASTERSLAVAREAGNELFAAQALNSLGIINRARAEYQKAIDAYTEAIAIRRRLADRRGESQVLGNLGNVYSELGQFDKAIEAQTRSLSIAKAVGYTAQIGFSEHSLGEVLSQLERDGLPHFEQALSVWRRIDRQAEVARTLRYIAVQRLFRKHDLAGARTALDEALAISRRLHDRDAEGYVLLNLGQLARAGGRLPAALMRFAEGLDVARASGSPDLEFELLAERGRARLQSGERDAGIADLEASAVIVNDIRKRVSSDEAKIAFVDTRQDVFAELAAALVDAGRPAAALEAAEAGRARAFADVLQSRQVRTRADDQRTIDEIRAALLVRPSPAPETAAADPSPALERLRRQNEELASLFTAESPRVDEIRATARRLGATLVEYLVTPARLLVFVVSADGGIRTASTDVSDVRLTALSTKLLSAFGTADAAALQADAVPHATLRELHRLVVAPIEGLLPRDSGSRVVIIPHGPLTPLPFAALEDSRGVPLVARYTLTLAPSAALFRYTSAKRRLVAPGSRSMIFAAPTAPGDAQLRPLPGSLDEGRQVAGRLRRFAPTLVEGARASERLAKTRLRTATYVHFATHGLVSDVRPADSSLVLAAGDGEDGYLRAAEIYGLELAADLVVLSGCSTARGRVGGDGVFGLPRAFIYAGAPSVVASLWDISDRATVFLMDRFYAELLRTGDKASALRTAQLATRQRHPNPALWAPFALIGEPR